MSINYNPRLETISWIQFHIRDGRSADVDNDRRADSPFTYCTFFDYGSTLALQSKGLLRSKNEYGLAAETFAYTGVNDTYIFGSTSTYAPSGLLKIPMPTLLRPAPWLPVR